MLLTLSTNNLTYIRSATVFAEGIFEGGETIVSHPPTEQVSSVIEIALFPPKDVPTEIHVTVSVFFWIFLVRESLINQ